MTINEIIITGLIVFLTYILIVFGRLATEIYARRDY